MEHNTAAPRSILRRVIIVLLVLMLLIALFLLGVRLYFRLPLSDYYRASDKAFRIPGLSDGFIPQGLDFDSDRGQWLVTGYQKDGSASPLYLLSEDASQEKTLYFALSDGSPYLGHAGGLALMGDRLYLAGGEDGCVYVYDYSALLDAPDGASVPALGSISTALSEDDCLGPAFVTIARDALIVGEFYRDVDYPTPDNHIVECASGDTHRALALVYPMDPDDPLGVASAPTLAYSLPEQIQGMYFSEGRWYLSASWGLSRSTVSVYEDAHLTRENDVTLLGYTLPCYSLSADSRLSTVQFPPMAEEIVVRRGKLYVMNESASRKYIFGIFTGGSWCYGTDLTYLLPSE